MKLDYYFIDGVLEELEMIKQVILTNQQDFDDYIQNGTFDRRDGAAHYTAKEIYREMYVSNIALTHTLQVLNENIEQFKVDYSNTKIIEEKAENDVESLKTISITKEQMKLIMMALEGLKYEIEGEEKMQNYITPVENLLKEMYNVK